MGEHTVQPLFPSRILMHRIMLCTILVSTLIGYVFFVVMIELPQRFQVVNGKTPEQAGICLLAVSGASALGSGIGVAASSRRNLTFWTMNAGSALVLLGTGLLYTINASKAVAAKIFVFEVVVGFGLGIIASASTIVIKIEAEVEDAASAQGLTSQGRLTGGNLGLAISTILLNYHITTDLGGEVSPEVLDKLRHSLLALSEATPAQQEDVRTIFAEAFRKNMLSCTCIAALALVIGLFSYQKNPPNLVQMPREGSSPSRKTPTSQLEIWRPGGNTVAVNHRDVEAQPTLTPHFFWSEHPTTPIFADQFVHTYDSPSPSDHWNGTNMLTALPRIRRMHTCDFPRYKKKELQPLTNP
ncbi:hypothetical protein KEM54_005450 [Ascosphaera aggregata]|nr:hypothetical protein KEM54_005450 [Ascosphaera aggregata]